MGKFRGNNLRTARLFAEKTLDDVAESVGKTRQYIHKLEVDGHLTPSDTIVSGLSSALSVEPEFFSNDQITPVHEDAVHFRKQFTTRATIKNIAIAKAEMFSYVVGFLDRKLHMPDIAFIDIGNASSVEQVENAAEKFRFSLGLGQGPIANVTRIAESCGAVVTTFAGVSEQVDALSVSSGRPIIVRNDAKRSPFRQRFDIAHEVGHFILHQGIVTGDHRTEGDANRFASAFLLPKAMMLKFFPQPKGIRLSWAALSDFKRTWRVSKAAILYRARQLELLSEAQYRSGVINLRSNGEAKEEREDHEFESEKPEVVPQAVDLLYRDAKINHERLAKEIGVRPQVLNSLGVSPSSLEGQPMHTAKIINFSRH